MQETRITRIACLTGIGYIVNCAAFSPVGITAVSSGYDKNLLIALTQEHSPEIYSRRFLEKHRLGAPSSLQKATKKLIGIELIQQANGSYEIADLFFKRWVQHISG